MRKTPIPRPKLRYLPRSLKRWCVVDLTWLDAGGNFGEGAGELPEEYRPDRFYWDRAQAEAELAKRKQQAPARRFYLFEATGMVVDSAVRPGAWHIENL